MTVADYHLLSVIANLLNEKMSTQTSPYLLLTSSHHSKRLIMPIRQHCKGSTHVRSSQYMYNLPKHIRVIPLFTPAHECQNHTRSHHPPAHHFPSRKTHPLTARELHQRRADGDASVAEHAVHAHGQQSHQRNQNEHRCRRPSHQSAHLPRHRRNAQRPGEIPIASALLDDTVIIDGKHFRLAFRHRPVVAATERRERELDVFVFVPVDVVGEILEFARVICAVDERRAGEPGGVEEGHARADGKGDRDENPEVTPAVQCATHDVENRIRTFETGSCGWPLLSDDVLSTCSVCDTLLADEYQQTPVDVRNSRVRVVTFQTKFR